MARKTGNEGPGRGDPLWGWLSRKSSPSHNLRVGVVGSRQPVPSCPLPGLLALLISHQPSSPTHQSWEPVQSFVLLFLNDPFLETEWRPRMSQLQSSLVGCCSGCLAEPNISPCWQVRGASVDRCQMPAQLNSLGFSLGQGSVWGELGGRQVH